MAFTPNTTPTPNWLYNGEMKNMNETELKVVLLVTRKTLGWFDPMTNERKEQDNISQSQFIHFTGKSHTAIAQAIQSSVQNGWIIARDKKGNLCDTSDKRKRRKVWYQLGTIFTRKISKQQSGQDENLSNISNKSKQHNVSNLSNKVANTKETNTKETNTKDVEQAQPSPKTEIFEFSSYLKSMRENKLRGVRIIALYWCHKGYMLENKEQAQRSIKRDLRAANQLVGYKDEQIQATMRLLDSLKDLPKWTLETVHKYIDEIKKSPKEEERIRV